METRRFENLAEEEMSNNDFDFSSQKDFLEYVNKNSFLERWEKNDFETFKKDLIQINGLMRGIDVDKRQMDGDVVKIGNQRGDLDYLPPQPEDKEELLREVFEGLKVANNQKDKALLIYLSIQDLHLFNDGNGRLGRTIYALLEKGGKGEILKEEELNGLVIHDGESGPGRKKFEEVIKSPRKIHDIVNRMLLKDLMGSEFIKKYGKVYEGLQDGALEGEAINEDLPEDIQKTLDKIFSEAGTGTSSFRGITLLKFLSDRGILEKYKRPDRALSLKTPDKYLLNFDGEKAMHDLDKDGASEIIRNYWQIKKQSIEKMIDIIIKSEKYRGTSGKSLKDIFYQEEQDLKSPEKIPYEGEALSKFLIEKQNVNKYEGELAPISEEFEKIYKKLPEAANRIIEEYKLLCDKWHLEPGRIKLYMVGGRIKGKPLSIDSDIDLLICVENPKKSPSAMLYDRFKEDPASEALDFHSYLITEVHAILPRICDELGIPKQFHLMEEGGHFPEKAMDNSDTSLLIGIG